jgi:formylglycine-generating enzyme required for sulfatase activity/serine/threonine protein kinase
MTLSSIGRYQVIRPLGSGGMADVYLARDPDLEREVAIKVPTLERLSDEALERFKVEARAVARLEHPAIVPLYDYGSQDRQPFLVMRNMPGGSLADLIGAPGFALREAIPVIERIAAALDYAHARGVLHRDVKPGNILFDSAGAAYLSDFGIARLTDPTDDNTARRLTAAGLAPGTAAYMSPEQVLGETDMKGRGDVYSLGVVLFEMLAGELPYKADSAFKQAMQHIAAPIPSILTARPDLPETMQAVIELALAKEPDGRYPTAMALADDLWTVAASPPAKPVLPMPAKATAQPQEQKYPPPPDGLRSLKDAEPTVDSGWLGEGPEAVELVRRAIPFWLWAGLLMLIALALSAVLLSGRDNGNLTSAATGAPVATDGKTTPASATEILSPRPATPAPTTPSALTAAAPTPEGETIHVLQAGENLFRVGLRYGFTVEELATYNGILNPNVLTVGQQIRIPPSEQSSVDPTATEPPSPSLAPSSTPSPTLSVANMVPTVVVVGAIDMRDVFRGGLEVIQVFVPAGSFRMGTETGQADERPVHDVQLDAFWLDRTEVTNAQFAAFVEDTGLLTTAERDGRGNIYTPDNWQPLAGADWLHPQGPGSDADPDHPVVLVTWDEADAFCRWAGGRLPTEAEWEYAARGPESLTYPWGESLNPAGHNFCDHNCPFDWRDDHLEDGYRYTSPAGTFTTGASWTGAIDLLGNVWEWVNDWHGDATYSESTSSNPVGPSTGDLRVARGAAWMNESDVHYSANRARGFPAAAYNGFGFRCAGNKE